MTDKAIVSEVVAGRLERADRLVDDVKVIVGKTISPKAALELVNTIRNGMGVDPLDDLPPGDRGNPQSCVIARALTVGDVSASVGGSIVLTGLAEGEEDVFAMLGLGEVTGDGEVTITDEAVGRFIGLFDRGELEQYDAEKVE